MLPRRGDPGCKECAPPYSEVLYVYTQKARARKAELVLLIPANPPLNQTTPVDLGGGKAGDVANLGN